MVLLDGLADGRWAVLRKTHHRLVNGSARLYAAGGAPLIDIAPIVPLAAEHSVGIAAISYAGGATFGLYADRATVPDLDVLCDGIVTSLHELAAPAHAPAAAR